jgi:RimJ/RimL family protein N-acetyltransferase
MFAVQCGMKAEGTIRQSFKKNGEIYDQWILGITRKELEARYE